MALEPDRQPAYKYLPMSQGQALIRILNLLPGFGSMQIRCVTEVHPVDRAPPYTALSYTWGLEEPRQEIELDGQLFMVRPNLHNFLRRIRHDKSTCVIWIDAICIDQENPVEKGHQVAMMGDIYRSARDVQVWLGEAADNSDQAMDLLLEIEGSGRTMDEQRNNIVREVYRQRVGKPLLKLYTRPYWQRVWILQEVFLAKDIRIICGSRDFDPSRMYPGDQFMSPWRIVLSQSDIEPTDVVFRLEQFDAIGRPSPHNPEEFHCIGIGA
ncbi:hypothetical protein INS49_000126 [Diaporthe citri]|uniref:uncharacterized protein n=1 Tax=Diaporthe citri TaxID=83186 RepID=UPI001C815B09|nr:uncharacterized protein INS49_000126 [Diaporthe citri]KAG6365950.1 hypothetical protein INS49_000126 [Diaporthe citri]